MELIEDMKSAQAGILAPVSPQGRYLFFSLRHTEVLGECLLHLAALADGRNVVAGLAARWSTRWAQKCQGCASFR